MDSGPGMSIVVRVVARWLFGLVILFGLAVAFFGHLTPGGGFAGGVIVACGFVLATLAFGAATGPSAWLRRRASAIDALGALSYLVIGILGWTGAHFFQAWIARGEVFTLGSAPCVLLLNLAVLVKVGAGLFAGFAAVAAFAPSPDGGKEETE